MHTEWWSLLVVHLREEVGKWRPRGGSRRDTLHIAVETPALFDMCSCIICDKDVFLYYLCNKKMIKKYKSRICCRGKRASCWESAASALPPAGWEEAFWCLRSRVPPCPGGWPQVTLPWAGVDAGACCKEPPLSVFPPPA